MSAKYETVQCLVCATVDLGSIREFKQLDEFFPIFLVFGDKILKASIYGFVALIFLAARLRVIRGCRESLYSHQS